MSVFNCFVWRDLVRNFLTCGTNATPSSYDHAIPHMSHGILIAHFIERYMDNWHKAPDF
jgi:hypothetical protein